MTFCVGIRSQERFLTVVVIVRITIVRLAVGDAGVDIVAAVVVLVCMDVMYFELCMHQ